MKTDDYYNVGEFIKLLHNLALEIAEELQKSGISAFITDKVGRDILLKKHRLHHIINITVGKNDKITVLNTRRILTLKGLKLVGEIYQGKGILYRDEWLYSDDKYQVLIRINYLTMSNGEPIPNVRSEFQINPLVINPYQLLYEAYGVLLNNNKMRNEVEQDIVELIKLIARSDLR